MACDSLMGHTTRVCVPLFVGVQRQFLANQDFVIYSYHFTPFSLLFD